MQRIKLEDNAVSDPVTGVPIFSESLPPMPPTLMRDYWLNSVQEEIASVIESSGMSLDPSKNTQLGDAILKIRGFMSNATINVGESYALKTIHAAIESLYGRYIAPGVTVTLQLEAGEYELIAPIVNRHPQGSQIIIRGGDTVLDSGNYLIKCYTHSMPAGSRFGVLASGNQRINIHGVMLRDDGTSHPEPCYGVCSRDNGTVLITESVITFWTGSAVLAEDGGRIVISNSRLSNTNKDGLPDQHPQILPGGMVGSDVPPNLIPTDGPPPFYAVYGCAAYARRRGVLEIINCEFANTTSVDAIYATESAVVRYINCPEAPDKNIQVQEDAKFYSINSTIGYVFADAKGMINLNATLVHHIRMWGQCHLHMFNSVLDGQNDGAYGINMSGGCSAYFDFSTIRNVNNVALGFQVASNVVVTRLKIQNCTTGLSGGYGAMITGDPTFVSVTTQRAESPANDPSSNII